MSDPSGPPPWTAGTVPWAEPAAPPARRTGEVRRLRPGRGRVAALAFLILMVLLFGLGPRLWPLDPGAADPGARDLRPVYAAWWESGARVDPAHPLGTDAAGRDGLARLLAAGRLSLAVAGAAAGLSLLLGTLAGLLAAAGGRAGALLRLVAGPAGALALPLLFLAPVLFRGPAVERLGTEAGAVLLLAVAVGLASWGPTARRVSGRLRGVRERDLVLAARMAGLPPGRIARRHLLPPLLGAIGASAPSALALALLAEAGLGLLGLGLAPEAPGWGGLLREARDVLPGFPERAFWPALCLVLTLLSLNRLGDGLGRPGGGR